MRKRLYGKQSCGGAQPADSAGSTGDSTDGGGSQLSVANRDHNNRLYEHTQTLAMLADTKIRLNQKTLQHPRRMTILVNTMLTTHRIPWMTARMC